MVALTTFSDLVSEAREKALADARAAGLPESPRLAEDGTGAEAYADAVATYLGMNVSRLANRQATLTFWDSKGENVQQVFARQALPMTWDFCEGNPFSNSSGNFLGQLSYLTKALELSSAPISSGIIKLADATRDGSSTTPWLIATDPPYYDNIGYADLSDFFYVWLRKAIRPILPDLFRTVLVPKAEELVATPYRHGGKDEAEQFFMRGMNRAMRRFNQSVEGYPMSIFYAFRQSESNADGKTSKGWATFLQAIIDSGLSVDGTWPVRTELSGNLKKKVNALASSIVLVCRKRAENAPVTTRAEFLRALKRELPDALKLLQHGNIAPVDMAQASIGPGMAIFTRYAKVLEADDSPMTVKTALQLINTALDEFLSEQEAEYDPHTRFAITWFETHSMEPAAYGVAETLATARNVSVAGVAEAGLIESRGGKVRLLSRGEMPADWNPANDSRPTVWEATQHLIRRLEEDGEPAAADLLRRLDAHAGPARDLAYRLYQVCERNKWADEGRAYNGLVIAWPELLKLARTAPENPLI